jgi:hypothetical protein
LLQHLLKGWEAGPHRDFLEPLQLLIDGQQLGLGRISHRFVAGTVKFAVDKQGCGIRHALPRPFAGSLEDRDAALALTSDLVGLLQPAPCPVERGQEFCVRRRERGEDPAHQVEHRRVDRRGCPSPVA